MAFFSLEAHEVIDVSMPFTNYDVVASMSIASKESVVRVDDTSVLDGEVGTLRNCMKYEAESPFK